MKKVYLLILLEILLSFYARLNYLPLYQTFGFYQGDIWYFYTYFNNQIRNLFFYPFDYPSGYILIHKLTYWISLNVLRNNSYESFLTANALLIIPTLLMMVHLILKIARIYSIDTKKILPFLILSPSLFVYSNINYDLFPTFLVILATYLVMKQKYAFSFASLALGTSIKFYPIFLVPIFIMFMINENVKIKQLIKSLFSFLVIFLVINLPFMIYNLQFWIHPYLYQSANPEKNDPTTISYYLFNQTTLGLLQDYFVFLLLLVSYFICWRFLISKTLDKNFLLILLLTCFSLVFGNHVYTPQYFLWFMPFVALTQIPNFGIWILYDVLNAITRLAYFKLKGELVFYIFWGLTVVYFIYLYILILANVKKNLRK